VLKGSLKAGSSYERQRLLARQLQNNALTRVATVMDVAKGLLRAVDELLGAREHEQ
jgi:hypothetical protein